jgi:hypothetical protein
MLKIVRQELSNLHDLMRCNEVLENMLSLLHVKAQFSSLYILSFSKISSVSGVLPLPRALPLDPTGAPPDPEARAPRLTKHIRSSLPQTAARSATDPNTDPTYPTTHITNTPTKYHQVRGVFQSTEIKLFN